MDCKWPDLDRLIKNLLSSYVKTYDGLDKQTDMYGTTWRIKDCDNQY